MDGNYIRVWEKNFWNEDKPLYLLGKFTAEEIKDLFFRQDIVEKCDNLKKFLDHEMFTFPIIVFVITLILMLEGCFLFFEKWMYIIITSGELILFILSFYCSERANDYFPGSHSGLMRIAKKRKKLKKKKN